MDTDALWQAIAAYGNARWRGVKFEQDAADHLSEIKAILNRAEAETRELLATNERLVDEVAELKAAYESQFKELHELKAKLTDKASLLRGCYARINGLEKAVNGAIPAMREYARKNPKHHFSPDGLEQDPNGAHAWLARNDGAALEKKHEGTT